MAMPGGLIFMIAAAAVTLSLAWLSWRLWESRFLKLKRHFPYGASAEEAAQTGVAPSFTA